MLLNFQNVEDIKKVLDNLTSYEKLELANNIYIGRNQSDFIDSKGNFFEELDKETEINNFYEELNNIFIKIYNTHKKVEKYLIRKFQRIGRLNIVSQFYLYLFHLYQNIYTLLVIFELNIFLLFYDCYKFL